LRAVWGDPEGKVPLIRSAGIAPVQTLQDALRLGEAVALELRARVGPEQ
jgi:hydroxymethylbilane synthase